MYHVNARIYNSWAVGCAQALSQVSIKMFERWWVTKMFECWWETVPNRNAHIDFGAFHWTTCHGWWNTVASLWSENQTTDPKINRKSHGHVFFGDKGGVLMTISRRVKQLVHNTTPAYCRSQRRFLEEIARGAMQKHSFYAGQCTCSRGGNDHACFGELGILLHW